MPELLLKTMSEDVIGVIPGVHNLRMNVKFSEPSEISFEVPAVIDGVKNWIYDRITGHKIIYTKEYGVYLVMNPETSSDGMDEKKTVKGYSIEKELDTKKFFLEEGTFKFYDQTNARNPDTIMGRIFEIAAGWSAGYISPALAQRYRTFDQYDNYLLSFVYNDAAEKFRCVFVFDPYKRTINAYDADETIDTIPIYLDFDNLMTELDVEEISDELVTALRPYGADGLDIRDVNPIGTNWIYDLSWFIANGDLPEDLASKWNVWQRTILNNQQVYRGLTALRASTTATLLAAQAALTDLNGELENLIAQQSVTIQALAMETTSAGISSQQSLLDQINAQIAAKRQEIANQEAQIADIESRLDASNPNSYTGQIQAMAERLAIGNFFTEDEYAALSRYLIEQDMTENTFVATSVDTTVSGQSYSVSNTQVQISGASISRIDLTSQFGKQMYTIAGGTLTLSGGYSLSCDIIRGTMEEMSSGQYVMSIYAGTITAGNSQSPSGMLTLSGSLTGLGSDIHAVTVDEVTTYEGTSLQFTSASGSMYLTANVSDYQKYSVQMELFDFAAGVLSDAATPTYEFSVDSGNFIFARDFAPFRERLELGKSVYLRIGEGEVITPYIIEFELDFEEWSRFSLIFSNRFKRHDNCNTLKDMIEQSYSSSRSFDASKYIYNQAANQMSSVSQFMNDSLDAAKNTILAAANQTVIIDGAGIHVGGDSDCQLRIVNSMIAITDDNWAHAKLAIGLFASEEVGEYFGVNAEVIGGKLIVGNNLIIENETDEGVMQFKVDSSGAWLNNATFVVQSDSGGKIIIDPKYGIAAGNGSLYQVDGTTVSPSFAGSGGDLILDSDGFPQNANFYLDIRNGNAYFRGNLVATSGEIGGFTIEDDYLYTGSGSNYVALNGSGTNANSAYAFWAGSASPANARFWVRKDGTISAKDGIFSGTLSAARLSGNLTADANSWLIGCGINVGNGNFYVDTNGNVNMRGSINLAGNITWSTGSSPCQVLYARYYMASPVGSYNNYPSYSANGWHTVFDSSYDYYASYTYDGGLSWTAAIKIRGEDGRDGQDGMDGDDADVTRQSIYRALLDAAYDDGIYSYNGDILINASAIKTGSIDAGEIYLENEYGGFRCAMGYDGSQNTYGAMMYGSDSAFYFIATNRGVRMQGGNNDVTVTDYGVFASDDLTVNSDRRLKNSISYDVDKYDTFFRGLKPSFFKMNDDFAQKFHIGFIAQDVEQALLDAGLTAEDFAGLVKATEPGAVHGKFEDQYYIKYSEFISLNTYMIQSLLRRVDDLEEKLEQTNERSVS